MLEKFTGRLGAQSEASRGLQSVLGLLLLSALFFANVLFTNQVLVSDNLDRYFPWKHYSADEPHDTALNGIRDRVLEEYPQRLIAARIVKNGELPLWNPHYLGGVPLLATDPGRGFFYPFNAIFYLMDPLRALGYASFVQLFLAAMFMYFYLRAIELRGEAAFLGAAVFGLGGYFLPYLSWLERINTGTWMPLMFLCVEKLFRGKGWIWAVVMGFAVGMASLAGQFPVVAYELLALGLYSIWRLLSVLRDGSRRRATELTVLVSVGVILGTLLAAIQLLPTYDGLRFIDRAHRPYDERVERGPVAHVLAMALVPDIFGNPVDPPPWGRHRFGEHIPGYYAPSSTYAGVLPLVLAAWVLVIRKERLSLFFAFLAALSISIFLDTIVFRLLYYVPVFTFGRQVEAKIIYMFAVSVLAGAGLKSLLESTGEAADTLLRRSGIALSLVVIAIITVLGLGAIVAYSRGVDNLGLTGDWFVYNVGNLLRFGVLVSACSALLLLLSRRMITPRLFSLLAITLTVGDLFYYGWRFNPPQDPGGLYPETEGIRFLQADQGVFRIMRGPRGKHTLPPNTPAVYDLMDAGGYRALLLDYYGDFMNLVEEGLYDVEGIQFRTIRSLRQAESVSSKLLDLLNVKYILSNPTGREDLTSFVASDETTQLVYQGDMRIYENKNVLPRAFVVTDFKVLADREEILSELTSERFDPRGYVILDEDPDRSLVVTSPGTANSSAHLLEYTPNRVAIRAEMTSPGFLVLSDLYYDGWKVLVDGEEERIHRADYVFRAVQLREGSHFVEFVFDPLPFKIGLSISAVTFAGSISLSIYWLLRRRLFAGFHTADDGD